MGAAMWVMWALRCSCVFIVLVVSEQPHQQRLTDYLKMNCSVFCAGAGLYTPIFRVKWSGGTHVHYSIPSCLAASCLGCHSASMFSSQLLLLHLHLWAGVQASFPDAPGCVYGGRRRAPRCQQRTRIARASRGVPQPSTLWRAATFDEHTQVA